MLLNAGQTLTKRPPGVPGDVITRRPHLISGYWNRAEATHNSIRDGWF